MPDFRPERRATRVRIRRKRGGRRQARPLGVWRAAGMDAGTATRTRKASSHNAPLRTPPPCPPGRESPPRPAGHRTAARMHILIFPLSVPSHSRYTSAPDSLVRRLSILPIRRALGHHSCSPSPSPPQLVISGPHHPRVLTARLPAAVAMPPKRPPPLPRSLFTGEGPLSPGKYLGGGSVECAS